MKKAKKSANTKLLIAFLALTLVVICAIGGTIAWLVAYTEPVTNTFTDSHVDITLAESEGLDFTMIPGHTIEKDPVVTVLGGSEACWLFVEIEESEYLVDYIEYAVADGWTQGDDTNIPATVYYREVPASDTDEEFHILAGDMVTVHRQVTEEMMDAIENGSTPYPTLTFKAYAIQLYSTNDVKFDVAEAWAQISTNPNA